MIHSILTNPTYTGDLAQGRSRVKSYKVHEVESVPREEWVEVAGTHEAIIDYETFGVTRTVNSSSDILLKSSIVFISFSLFRSRRSAFY